LKPKPKPKPKSKLKSKLSFVIDSIFLIIAIVAVFSNPSEEEHKAAAKKALIQSREVRDLIKEYSGNVLGDIGKILATGVVLDEVIGLIVDELMERKNYIIFSFSSIPLREKAVIGFGAFGKVWIILDGKKAGEEISWAKYDSVQGFKEGFALVKLNSKYGFIDKTGKEITLCKYDYAESFSSELALVKLNSKYGFIDKTGKEIIPCKYDYAESFSGEFTMVKLNGKGCLINKKGRIIGTAIHKDEIKKHK
jgi:hypothetical protein